MKKKIKLKSILIMLAVLFFLTASLAFAEEVYSDINFNDELKQINRERTRRRSDYRRNHILFYLDRGMIHHKLGNWAESSADLEEAERLIEEAFTKSLTQGAASFIVNDNTIEYPGEDYEDIYINVFNALNYYYKGQIENAHVEIRRVNEKLTFMADKYERAIKKAKEADKRVADVPIDTTASRFSNSALARYLSILFSRAEGNADNMRIDWEELQRAYALAPAIYGSMPASLRSNIQAELAVPRNTARLNVLAFTGLSPIKEEQRMILPMPFPPPQNTAPLALPVIVHRPSNIQNAEVIITAQDGNVQRLRLELIENMGKVAEETFKSRYSLIVTKAVARTIIKTAASTAGSAVVADQMGGLAGLAVGVGARVATGTSERADLRISKHFPEKAHVGGINLAPGTYNITINFLGAGNYIITTEIFENVEVQAGRLNLLHAIR